MGSPDAGEGDVGAVDGMPGDLVEIEESVLQTVAGLLGGYVGAVITIEDGLLAYLLPHDLRPPWPVRVVGHHAQHLCQFFVSL